MERAGTAAEARLLVAKACRKLEAENSYLLSIGAALAVGDTRAIAARVKANRDAIDLLGRVYSGMTDMVVLMPDDY
jgi:hypothetical protein